MKTTPSAPVTRLSLCRRRLRDYAETVRRAHGLTMQSRIGLNSGEVGSAHHSP